MLFLRIPPQMFAVRTLSIMYPLAFSNAYARGCQFSFFGWVAGVGSRSQQNVNSMDCRLEFWVVQCSIFSREMVMVMTMMYGLSLAACRDMSKPCRDYVLQGEGVLLKGVLVFIRNVSCLRIGRVGACIFSITFCCVRLFDVIKGSVHTCKEQVKACINFLQWVEILWGRKTGWARFCVFFDFPYCSLRVCVICAYVHQGGDGGVN